MIASLSHRVLAGLCAVAGGLLVTFWTVWFVARDVLASEQRSEYFTFENAFPLADGWMAVCCFAAAWCLWRRRPMALLWLIAAGSASAFLTGMDVLYDLENDVYSKGGPAFIELAINVLTAAFAVLCLTWAWRRRAELLAISGAQGLSCSSAPPMPKASAEDLSHPGHGCDPASLGTSQGGR